MIARNTTNASLEQALTEINKKYKGNITFNRYPEPLNYHTTTFRFTLKCRDSKKEGHRRGFAFEGKQGRRLINACWHVHGDYFDALFKINPNATIKSGKQTITKDSGNWEDRNIGSITNPLMFSDACDCKKEGLNE